MGNFFLYLGAISFGSLIGIIIKHFLDKDRLKKEREYLFNKEELLFYRKISEKVISKILLLENHRELLLVFLKGKQDEKIEKGSKFIDLNDTFDKKKFERNIEEITTYIYMYFDNLGELWNECMNNMSEIYNIVYQIKISEENNMEINLISIIEQFNKKNIDFGDKPHELAELIKIDLNSRKENISGKK